MADDNAVSYFTPSINGFSAGAAVGDAGATSDADVAEYGLSYSQDVGGASVKLSYASGDTSKSASSADDGLSATSMGASITYGDLVTLASNSYKADNGSFDYDGTGVGVSYVLQEGLTLKAHTKSADDSRMLHMTNEVAASLTYVVAPGLTANVAYTDYDLTDGGTRHLVQLLQLT